MSRDILRLAEAAIALVLAQLVVRLLPFRWLAPVVEGPDPVPGGVAEPEPRVAAVGRAIVRAAGRLPWHSTCLVRALAARLVLTRTGIPSVLYLGVAKQDGAIRAHAWLLAGGGIVCGGREAPGFTPIAAITTGRTA